MRLLTRSLAAGTVMTGMLLGSIFSRFVTPAVAAPEGAYAPPPAAARVLPAGWSERVAERLRRDPLPVECEDLQAMIEIVNRCAGRFKLDPLTVLAVIKVESGFDPFAVSPVGATGLMQLRPDTAREVAARLGIEWTSDAALFEPEVNILLGTAYLRELLDRFDHLDVALAAFHSGPNRIAAQNAQLGATSVQYTDRVWDAIIDYHKSARVLSSIS